MSISDLEFGTSVQRRAFAALAEAKVFDHLADFRPVLAGTIPLGVDVAGSDLDVICEASDLIHFDRVAMLAFGNRPGFVAKTKIVRGIQTRVVRFAIEGFVVELFAQVTPVEAQYAVMHLRIERRLLALGGEPARAAIQRLKCDGVKTEPAFAAYFGIEGDPYDALAALSRVSDEDLRKRFGA